MAYVPLDTIHDPKTRELASSTWGDQVRDNMQYLDPERPRVCVYRSSTFSIPNASTTLVEWNAEYFDVGNCHSTVTNSERLTAPRAGFYYVWANVDYSTSSAGRRMLVLRDQDANDIGRRETGPAGNGNASQNLAVMVYLPESGYVTIGVYQNSGSARNVAASTSTNRWSQFGMCWMGE